MNAGRIKQTWSWVAARSDWKKENRSPTEIWIARREDGFWGCLRPRWSSWLNMICKREFRFLAASKRWKGTRGRKRGNQCVLGCGDCDWKVPRLAGGQKEKDGGVERTVREGSCSLKPGRDEDDLLESMKNVYAINFTIIFPMIWLLSDCIIFLGIFEQWFGNIFVFTWI